MHVPGTHRAIGIASVNYCQVLTHMYNTQTAGGVTLSKVRAEWVVSENCRQEKQEGCKWCLSAIAGKAERMNLL